MDIDGPGKLLGMTDKDGVITFPSVPIGKYKVLLSKYHSYADPAASAEHTREVKEKESFASIAFDEMIAPKRLAAVNQKLLAERDPNVLLDRTDLPGVPQDKVVIPQFQPRYFEVEVNCGKNLKTLVLDGTYTKFRYRLLRNGRPMENTPYEMKISTMEDKDPEVLPRRVQIKGDVIQEKPLPNAPKVWPLGPNEIKLPEVKIQLSGSPEACVTDKNGYFDHDIFAHSTVGKLTIKANLTATVDLTFGALYPLKLKDKDGKSVLYVLAAKQRLAQLGYFEGKIDNEDTEEYQVALMHFKEDLLFQEHDDPNIENMFVHDPKTGIDEKAAYWLSKCYGESTGVKIT